MNKQAIEQRTLEMMGKQLALSVGDLTRDRSLTVDLGIDSLDAVELVMDLEEEFNIDIFDLEINAMASANVGMLLDAVVAKVCNSVEA